MEPKFANGYNGRGLALDKMQQFEAAIRDFTKAIEIEGENAVYWHNRALCFRNMGLLNESIQDFDIALTIDPNSPVLYSNRGHIHRTMKEYQKAIEDYTCEIKYGGHSSAKAHNNRAFCYAKLNKYEEAISDYSKVVELDPKNVQAVYNRGLSLLKSAKYEKVKHSVDI